MTTGPLQHLHRPPPQASPPEGKKDPYAHPRPTIYRGYVQGLGVFAKVFAWCGMESGVGREGVGYRHPLFHLFLVQNPKDSENSE